jgi:hypothetical protein
LGGAVRVTSEQYFIDKFIHLRGDDVTMFGDGKTVVFHLKTPVSLKEISE